MKKLFPLFLFFFLLNCQSFNKPINSTAEDKMSFSKNEDGEYEIIVLDPQYETFLKTQQPKDFYTEASLKAKNQRSVIEWI